MDGVKFRNIYLNRKFNKFYFYIKIPKFSLIEFTRDANNYFKYKKFNNEQENETAEREVKAVWL